MWSRLFRSADAISRRDDRAFKIISDQLEKRDSRIDALFEQNASQAVEMKTMRRQIDQCKDAHEECEKRSDQQSRQINSLNARLSGVESKLLPDA